MDKNNKTWFVYKHTCPNDKVYIGITSDLPEKRWMSGWGYKTNVYFFKAIVKYGWVNIRHDILFEGLTKEEAEEKEIDLIASYKSSDNRYGYNLDLGGFLHIKYAQERELTKEYKAGLIKAEKERLKSLEYTPKITGHIVYKYDLNKKLICTYNTCKEAAEDAGVPYSTFQRWIRGGYPKNAKYIYSYGEFDEGKFKKYKQTFNAKPVDMFDLSLNYIQTFDSISEAGKYIEKTRGCKWSTAKSNIHNVCIRRYKNSKGDRLTAYNYIWRYHNENTDNKIA